MRLPAALRAQPVQAVSLRFTTVQKKKNGEKYCHVRCFMSPARLSGALALSVHGEVVKTKPLRLCCEIFFTTEPLSILSRARAPPRRVGDIKHQPVCEIYFHLVPSWIKINLTTKSVCQTTVRPRNSKKKYRGSCRVLL